jgi:hypothetical protein
MPRTIYSTAGAFPVALEGTKKVKTFPSGLVLVTQDYAVPRGQESNYAAMFAVGQPLEVDSPAIDGLYIFPEPEWVDSGDGFTRLTVSAYGRTNTVGTTTKRGFLYNQDFQISLIDYESPSVVRKRTALFSQIVVNTGTHYFCEGAGAAPNFSPPAGLVSAYAGNSNLEGLPIIPANYFPYLSPQDAEGFPFKNDTARTPVPLYVGAYPTRIDRTNFGAWDEFVVDYNAIGFPNTEGYFLGVFYIAGSAAALFTIGGITNTEFYISYRMPDPSTALRLTVSGTQIQNQTIPHNDFTDLNLSDFGPDWRIYKVRNLTPNTNYNITAAIMNGTTVRFTKNLTVRTTNQAS